jgi:mxaA protein
LILLALPWPSIAGEIVRFERHTPQPFGYFIGDVIRQQILIESDSDLVLARSTLPTSQPLTYWLDLRDVELRSHEGADGNRYIIDLEYQVFYSALTATRLEIPAIRLGFSTTSGQSGLIERKLPAWPFIVSSLRGLDTGVTGQQGLLRRDSLAVGVSTRAVRWRTLLSALVLLLLLPLLLHHYAYWPFDLRPARPFAGAQRQLRQALKNSGDDSDFSWMTILHRAFDETAGKRLFCEDLPEFFAQRPDFEQQAEEINRFYAASRQAFFHPTPDPIGENFTPTDATRLVSRLAELERSVQP